MDVRSGMDGIAAAYEGLESDFIDQDALWAYRYAALEGGAAQGDAIAGLLPVDAAVLEVGTGNGRLLIDLARRGALREALGIDLAHSRIAFAREWAAAEDVDGLRFEAGDALRLALGTGAWDAAVVVTGALAYFDAVEPGSARRLLDRLHAGLRPAGRLVLELYPHPEWRRMLEHSGGRARLWSELPPEDPWRFYLSDLRLDVDTGVVTHEKTFVHRRTGAVDQGRREQLRLYGPDELERLLHDAGFGAVEAFAGWTQAPYAGDELLVVTARRVDG